MALLGPRVVVAGTHSGVGKTTVATGLMAALRRRGVRVAAAKVGPDFIDPGYHAVATGRPGRNLDAWMCGAGAVAPLAARAAEGADVLVVEGVMGLFDGAADGGTGGPGSTAHVARLLRAPVVLVVDAASMSASVAAVVHGYRWLDPGVHLAGVVLNRVAGDAHETLLREALAALGIPVLGALRRDDGFVWRDRHLGLVPVVEQPAQVRDALDRLAAAVAGAVDLDAVLRLAGAPPPLRAGPPPAARPSGRCRLAVAAGPAFSFCYADNLELLAQAGAELVPFDPTADPSLPHGTDGLVAGGGFPEVHAEALAANRPLLDEVGGRVRAGMVTWAECGGLLWLCRSLVDRSVVDRSVVDRSVVDRPLVDRPLVDRSLGRQRLCGVIDADATMTGRLTLGYRHARTAVDTPLGPAGTEARGHEFHYSTVEPAGGALHLRSRFADSTAGFATPTMLASYLHLHLASDPRLAEHLVAAATAGARAGAPPAVPAAARTAATPGATGATG